MVRALLILATISAVLTSVLFLLVEGNITSGPVVTYEPRPMKRETGPVITEPPPGPASPGLAIGGPLVPVPSPTPEPAPPLPPVAEAAPPVGDLAPSPDPALASPPEPQSAQATPPSSATGAVVVPAPPQTLPPGTKVIYDQPKAGGKLWTGCTQFKSYNATTETYRGLDGQVHSCKRN